MAEYLFSVLVAAWVLLVIVAYRALILEDISRRQNRNLKVSDLYPKRDDHE